MREHVLATIKQQRLVMRPYWHYLLPAVLGLIGIVILTLLLIFLVSFILFMLTQSGVLFAPVFGLPGLRALLLSLPWVLIILALVFVAVLEVLVRRYTFTYRRPLLYSMGIIILLAAVGGFVIAQTPLHRGLFDRADRGRLPLAGPLYRELGAPQAHQIYPGRVREITMDGFYMVTPRREEFRVLINPDTQFLRGPDVAVEDIVVVFGERADRTIRARVIRRLDPNERPPFVPRPDQWRGQPDRLGPVSPQ